MVCWFSPLRVSRVNIYVLCVNVVLQSLIFLNNLYDFLIYTSLKGGVFRLSLTW